MTSSSASPPGFDANPPRGNPHEPADCAGSTAIPPADAVTLADLIADAGPLPPDAALECIQRLAEIFAREGWQGRHVDASNVLIDDDGNIWLRDGSTPGEAFADRHDSSQAAAVENIDGMNRIGRLLMFLVTGDRERVEAGPHADSVEIAQLPTPVAAVARRLFSRNGSCYPSCDVLARETASMRGDGVIPAAELPDIATPASEPPSEAVGDSTLDAPDAPTTDDEHAATEHSSSAALVMILLVVAGLVATVIWLSL